MKWLRAKLRAQCSIILGNGIGLGKTDEDKRTWNQGHQKLAQTSKGSLAKPVRF